MQQSDSENTQGQNKAVIVGAGLVGCLLGLFLAKKHSHLFPDGIEVYERRGDPRKEKGGAGRSINLALSNRSFKSLDSVDPELTQEIIRHGCKMFARYIHSRNAPYPCEYQPYGQKHQYILSIDRQWLNNFLLSKLEENPNVKVYFQYTKVIQSTQTEFFGPTEFTNLQFLDETTQKIHITRCRLVFGCDGANSALRTSLASHPKTRMCFSQTIMPYAYKELRINPDPKTGDFAMRSDCFHVWPRNRFTLIALANPTKDFTVTFFSDLNNNNTNGNPSHGAFSELDTDEKVINFFKTEFGDAYELMKDNLLQDWKKNPTSSLFHAECNPYYLEDKVVLLGDAAHAIVPFYGQGANCGLEDCRIISEFLSELKSLSDRAQVKNVLQQYSAFRKPSCDAISELSRENFEVLVAKTASKSFVIQKKFGIFLNHLFPNWYKPIYTMVTFSPDISYAEALRRHRNQEKWTKRIISFATVSVVASSLYFGGKYLFKEKKISWIKKILSNHS